jgi:hypothetical protein
MSHQPLVVVLPCLNEADNIAHVISNLRTVSPSQIYIGLDPATSDNTAAIASGLGCIVVEAQKSGYDPAVAEATLRARSDYPKSYILYTDAGNKYAYTVVPQMIVKMSSGSDIVLAVRIDQNRSMLWHQKAGTKVVLSLINTFTGRSFHDISPFRMVNSDIFKKIDMQPQQFRWPSEMLVKASAVGCHISEVEVISLKRAGTSKVSGSLINTARAGLQMLSSLQFIFYKKGGVK